MVIGINGTMNINVRQLRRNLTLSIPPKKGVFMMTAESACPSGWTEDTDFVDRYPLGANADLGTTGGTESYSHTHTGGWIDDYYGSSGSSLAAATSSNTTPTWYPPFFKVRFCVKD